MVSERKDNPSTTGTPPHRRRLLVVAGKGGVGRSTVAAGLAVAAARDGQRVLAIDGLADGGLRRAFDGWHDDLVDIIKLETEAALREYLDLHVNVPLPGLRLGPIASAFDFLAVAAPGVKEILAMGKVCNEVRKDAYDVVILDAPATGHVVELLASPDTLADLIPVGPLTKQTAWMRAMLAEETSSVVIVTLAEELPVAETLELATQIPAKTSVRVQAIIGNRVPTPLTPGGATEARRLAAASGPLGVGAQMLLERRDRSADALAPLAAATGLPMVIVAESDGTRRVVEHVADAVGTLL